MDGWPAAFAGASSPAMKEGRTSREVKRLLPDAP